MAKKHIGGQGVIGIKKKNNANAIQHIRLCDNNKLQKAKYIVDTMKKLIYFIFFCFLLIYFVLFYFIYIELQNGVKKFKKLENHELIYHLNLH